jgi:hypothetical protein
MLVETMHFLEGQHYGYLIIPDTSLWGCAEPWKIIFKVLRGEGILFHWVLLQHSFRKLQPMVVA